MKNLSKLIACLPLVFGLVACDNAPKVGPVGPQGEAGEKGDKGDKGDDGKSAYDLYKEKHPDYKGDEDQFLDDLLNGRLGNKEVHVVHFDLAVPDDEPEKPEEEIPDQPVMHGEKAKNPGDPVLATYEFERWTYVDAETKKDSFETWFFTGSVVTEDMILKAHYDPMQVLYVSEKSICLTEESPSAQIKAKAYHVDDDGLKFRLSEGSPTDVCTVDENTGVVKVVEPYKHGGVVNIDVVPASSALKPVTVRIDLDASDLRKAVADLPDGELNGKPLATILDPDVLASGDKFNYTKSIMHQSRYAASASNFNLDLMSPEDKMDNIYDQAFYEDYSYASNDLIEVSTEESLFPYNPETGDISEEEIKKAGTGIIGKKVAEDDHLTYEYQNMEKPEDSFKLAMDKSHKIEDLREDQGIGAVVPSGMKFVHDMWDMTAEQLRIAKYKSQLEASYAAKSGDVVYIAFQSQFTLAMFGIYQPLELLMADKVYSGYTTDGDPIKATNSVDGLFLDMGYSFGYEIYIVNNIVAMADFTFYSMVTSVYKDTKAPADGNIFTPGYLTDDGILDISVEELEAGRLVPYTDPIVLRDDAGNPIEKDSDGNPVEIEYKMNGVVDRRKPHVVSGILMTETFVASEDVGDPLDFAIVEKDSEGNDIAFKDQKLDENGVPLFEGAFFDDAYLINPVASEEAPAPTEGGDAA